MSERYNSEINKMMKTINKKIAVMMILLVVMIPIYSSMVLADLSNIQVRGQDDVNNFVREEDFITFKATASLTGDSQITSNQVNLGSAFEFDSCSKGISGFDCQLRVPENGTVLFDSKVIPYTVTLKNDVGSIVDSKSDVFFIDNLAPEMSSFDADTSLVSAGSLKFDFVAEDKACGDSACVGKCSGISRVELFEIGGNFQETVHVNSGSCIISRVFETTAARFSDGQHTVFAQAFDRVGQLSSAASATFDIDTNAPFIDINTFKIVDAVGGEISFFGPNPVPVLAVVEISDLELDKLSVTADLTELGGQIAGPDCGTTENGKTACAWSFNLNPGTAGLKSVKIEALDLTGNRAETIISRNFELDNIAPVVLSLASSRVSEGKNFAKLENNTFIATFKEEGVGLNPQDMILNFEAANECTRAVDIWQCTWNNVNFNNDGRVNVFIGTNSKDKLGNFVSQQFSREVTVDNSKPRLLGIAVRNIGQGPLNFTKTGDNLQVEAVVEDDSIAEASADFSRFIFSAGDLEPDACVKTSDKTFVCSWTTSSIDIEGFVKDFITLEFSDVSGNTLVHKEPLTVFGVSGIEEPDFFTSSVKCSPSLLDRETFPLINQRAYCLVNLKPKFENIVPLDISLGECQGDLGLVDSFELFNSQLGSREPVIRINFNKQDARVDDIDYLCPISIVSMNNKDIVVTPETENINFSFSFYNLPVGEVSQSVQQKIDDAVDDADNLLSIATFLKKVFFYAERICNVGNVIAQTIGFFKVIGSVWASSEAAAPPVVKEQIRIQRMLQDLSTENLRDAGLGSWKSTFNKFCGFVNCKTTFDANKEVDFSFGGAEAVLGKWQAWGSDAIEFLDAGDIVQDYVGKGGKVTDPAQYMDPKHSIVVATLTACIPGIIYGLDKYRQIQCMYADCLQTGVGEQGLPVFACEDQKDYATCKYVVGEIFSVIPIVAMFDYYMSLIKSTLANPFKIIGVALSASCREYIGLPNPFGYHGCAVIKIVSFLGITIQEVTSIIDSDTWKIHDDFCKNLDKNEEKESSSRGLF